MILCSDPIDVVSRSHYGDEGGSNNNNNNNDNNNDNKHTNAGTTE
jgi:hypothetical protein